MEHPEYSKQYSTIHKCLRHSHKWCEGEKIPFGESCVYCLDYSSKNKHYLIGRRSYKCKKHMATFPSEPVAEKPSDIQVEENINFRHLLLRECPSSGPLKRHERVTILLHGLNERALLKYMPWAYHVWLRTEEPVVLFPLSFSINRVHPDWRKQIKKTHERRKAKEGNARAHAFNATISERLESHPERFFWGAMQSYWDIIDFVRQIRDPKGKSEINKHIAPDARVDFLGYSSGGYLALAFLAVNHKGLFSESHACLYATCVEMDELRPASPYVVDEAAERALRHFYVDKFEDPPDESAGNMPNKRMRHWLDQHPEGRWMSNFGGLSPDRQSRDARLKEIAPRLLGIANTNDLVMRWRPMRDVLKGDERDTSVRFEKLDLGIHEGSFTFKDYKQAESEFIKGTVNEQLYGRGFEQFIEWIVGHLE